MQTVRIFSWAPKSPQMVTADMKIQGSRACCNPWGRKESDMTEWLNNNKYTGQQRLKVFREQMNHRADSERTPSCYVVSSSVQLLSCMWLFATPWTAACHALLSITNSQSLLKLISIESVIPSNHLALYCPLLLQPSIVPSIRVFSNESVLPIRWPQYWSFSFNISPSKEESGLISFRIDWFDLLAVQGILKSLLQHHSSKASILQYSAFFMLQLSHPYMTTGKAIALPRWTFAGKVISLLFNMLSRLLIAFLRRSKHLLISWQWFWSSRK